MKQFPQCLLAFSIGTEKSYYSDFWFFWSSPPPPVALSIFLLDWFLNFMIVILFWIFLLHMMDAWRFSVWKLKFLSNHFLILFHLNFLFSFKVLDKVYSSIGDLQYISLIIYPHLLFLCFESGCYCSNLLNVGIPGLNL